MTQKENIKRLSLHHPTIGSSTMYSIAVITQNRVRNIFIGLNIIQSKCVARYRHRQRRVFPLDLIIIHQYGEISKNRHLQSQGVAVVQPAKAIQKKVTLTGLYLIAMATYAKKLMHLAPGETITHNNIVQAGLLSSLSCRKWPIHSSRLGTKIGAVMDKTGSSENDMNYPAGESNGRHVKTIDLCVGVKYYYFHSSLPQSTFRSGILFTVFEHGF